VTPWPQNYDPIGFWPISTLIASLPIVVLFYLLAFRRVGAAWSAAGGALTALLIAVVVFGMPASLAAASFGYGVAFGLVKIAWIVFSAVFLYDIAVASGAFEIMKDSIAAISADRRLQALLIAFSFGAFIEGAAGFGAPVAISAAFMVGLGFQPFYAAALCLIANTAPVAWGALGTPVHTLAAVTALPEPDLNAMIGRILPFTSIIVPFWLVRTMVSWKETFAVLPAILVTGLFFAIPQYYWSNYQDSNLVDIVSSLVSLVAMVLLLRIWKPGETWRFPEEAAAPPKSAASTGAVFRAWMPFLILSIFVFLWGLPVVKSTLNVVTPVFPVPGLHQGVARVAPVVPQATPEAALFDFNWLSATGTGVFLAAIVSGLALGLSPRELARTVVGTAHRMRMPLVAIACMLGLGFVTRYSGVDAVLGLACTRTGILYPFFGTFLGWLGVALTGSDTSSNALFGSLQRITAEQLGFDPVLMAAANSSGGVMGKMVDAQSIVVATAATRQVGNEGRIFRFVLCHSIALGAIVGLIVMAYAFLFPHLVPHGLTFAE
jgi:lactate permease